jgi:hypothetical protein
MGSGRRFRLAVILSPWLQQTEDAGCDLTETVGPIDVVEQDRR